MSTDIALEKAGPAVKEKVMKRSKILEAAIKLFSDKGFSGLPRKKPPNLRK